MIGWIVVYAIAFAVVTALAAKSRGHDPMTWALVGFFFGVFGLIAVLVMQPRELEDDENTDWPSHTLATKSEKPTTKKCPDCAEEIKLEAKVCRFCGKRFDDTELPASDVPPSQPQAALIRPASPPQIPLSTKEHKTRNVRCPHCYTMNYDTDILCSVCGKELPIEE